MLNVLIMLVSGAVFAQAKPAYRTGRLVEKVTRKGDELVIPYEKYVLPNGLTLIVKYHPDRSALACLAQILGQGNNSCRKRHYHHG